MTVMIGAPGPGAEPMPAETRPTDRPECAKPGLHSRKTTLVFCGPIRAGDGKRVADAVRSARYQKLLVSSPGGLSGEAIAIARAIRTSGIEVGVFDMCLSACAHFLFMSARNLTVYPDTVVGFHHTGTSQKAMLDEAGVDVPESVRRQVDARSREATDFYAWAGLDPLMLEKPYRELRPKCLVKSAVHGAEPSLDARGAWVMWTPHRTFMSTILEQEIRGWWPEDRFDHLRVVARRFPDVSHPRAFKFQHVADFSEGPSFVGLDWCEPAEDE